MGAPQVTRLTPYPYQEADIARFIDAGGVGLLNACPGAGKTLVATEIVHRMKAGVTLIIAPLSTHNTAWAETVKGQTGQDIRKIGNGNKAEKTALFEMELGYPGYYITTPQFMTRYETQNWTLDALVCDEIHQYTAPTTKGFKKLKEITAPIRIAMSGTPARNHFVNLYGVCVFLWPELNGKDEVADDFFYFWKRNRMTSTKVWTKGRNGEAKQVEVFETEKIPGTLLRQMPLQISHHARERCCDAPEHANGVLGHLAEPIEMQEVIPLRADQKKIIKDMETTMVTWLQDHPMVAEIPLTAQQRIRQGILGTLTVDWTEDEEGNDVQTVSFDDDCKSPFLDRTLEILEDLGDETVIVWTDSAKFANVTVKRLNDAGIKTDQYSGSRKADLAGFGTDYRVLVAVPSSFGTGSDGAQRVCSNEIWLSRDLDRTTNHQAEARLQRNGQKYTVRRWLLWDDLGVASGNFGSQVEKQLLLNQSLRVDGA